MSHICFCMTSVSDSQVEPQKSLSRYLLAESCYKLILLWEVIVPGRPAKTDSILVSKLLKYCFIFWFTSLFVGEGSTELTMDIKIIAKR